MAILNANLSGISAKSFEAIPPGEYHVKLIDSEVKSSKLGKPMLKVTLEIVGPTHAGRKIFEHFMIGNEVAMARLKTMATVGGHRNPDYIQDTEELHGMEFLVNVKIDTQPGYDPQNKVTSFKEIKKNGHPPVTPTFTNPAAVASTPSASAPSSASPKMPWD